MRGATVLGIGVMAVGLVWGAIAVFVSLVGMVETFAAREIVAGIISLGHALLLLTALGAGYQAAGRAPQGRPLWSLLSGMLAGVAAGLVAAFFVILGTTVNLRGMFINASPDLFALLSFGREAAGAWLIILIFGLVALLGAAGRLLPGWAQRPVGGGLVTVTAAALFQDLVKLVLQTGAVRTTLRDLLYADGGLSLGGAAVLFLGTAGGSALWRARGAAVRQEVAHLPPGRRRALTRVALALAVMVAFYLPLAAGAFLSQVLVFVGLYILMGLGLNLEVGFAGLLDLGFVAFFAIGGYTVALLTSLGPLGIVQWSFWVALPIAFVVSLLAGVLLGVPVLGIRGDYLAIATLGFGEITRLLVLSSALRPWLGGSHGIVEIPKPLLAGLEFSGPEQIYWITLAVSALIAFVAMRLRSSRVGRAWMAIREDEDVAEAMGINTINMKLLAYGIGGGFAGVGGAIFAVLIGSIYPHSFSLLISINVLALIIVGGMGSLPGVIVGSLFLVGMPELLREFADFRFLIYGAVLIAMMQLRPEGLWPAAAQRRELHAEEAEVVKAAVPPGAAEGQVEA